MSSGNFIKNYYPLLIIIVVIGFVFILLMVFFVFRFAVEKERLSSRYSLCKDFSAAKGEISCEDAINLALEKYPGEIQSISLENISLRKMDRNVWLIDIISKDSFETPSGQTNAIQVAVDTTTGQDFLYKLFKKVESV